jgi:hypothetical protein
LIDSGSLNSGQSFSFTFYKHGFYPYECSFHSYMTGWVNVTGPDVQPRSSSTVASAIDYTPYIIGAVIAGTVVIVSLALLFRRRTQKSKST